MNMIASTLSSDQPSRVFNRDTADRLQQLNAAERQLRGLGVSIESRDLRVGSSLRPLLIVSFKKPLKDGQRLQLKQLAVTSVHGVRVQVGRLGEVDVAFTLAAVS